MNRLNRRGSGHSFGVTACATAAGMAGLLGQAGSAWATDYTINTTNMGIVSDSNCGLMEALREINDPSSPNVGCPAASGSSHRVFLQATTYSATESLSLERNVEVIGKGAGLTAINTTARLGVRAESATGGGMTMTLKDLTIRNVSPNLFVTGIYVIGTGTIDDVDALKFNLNGVRVLDCSTTGIIAETEARMDIRNSTIENNRGSGIDIDNANLFMFSSLIVNNSSPTSSGGGINFFGTGNNNIYNSTITGNTARLGGGLYVANGDGAYLNLHNTTVARNTATERGGGIVEATPTGNTKLRMDDSIVAYNTAPTHIDVSGFVESHRSLHGSTAGNTGTHDDEAGLNNVDALLGTLMDMGGPTRVLPLLKGSPAIDARVFIGGVGFGTVDQRGSPRPYNTKEDLGAFEDGPQEAELLLMAQKTANIEHTTTNSGPLSNNLATWFKATAATQFVTYLVSVPQTGNYRVRVQVRKANDRGTWQLSAAPTLDGTYVNIGGAQDHYRSTASTEEIDLGLINANSAGAKFFRFRATGKNAASLGFHLVVDYIWLVKQ